MPRRNSNARQKSLGSQWISQDFMSWLERNPTPVGLGKELPKGKRPLPTHRR